MTSLDGSAWATADLVERARGGDAEATDALLRRYLPRLHRVATGRLPAWARDLAETQDLVQETLMQAFKQLHRFDVRGEGALLAYLRQAVLNRIRSEIRRAGRRPTIGVVDSRIADRAESPLDAAIGRAHVERYERALAELRPADREVLVARLELGCTHEEIAQAVGKPSANAARMAVQRAMLRLLKALGHDGAPEDPRPAPAD